MRVRTWGAAALLVAATSLGCDAGRATLIVDLRTDYVPGQEVDGVTVWVEGPDGAEVARAERPLEPGDDLVAGVRALEGMVPVGPSRVRVRLTRTGDTVSERDVLVEVDAAVAVTVLITRDCAGIVCEPGTQCVGARCVDERCTPETPDTCPAPQCGGDGDCMAAVGCVTPRCIEATCLGTPADTLCRPGETCDPVEGCRASGPVDWAGAGPRFGPIEALAALNLVGVDDYDPFLSADGLTLYFASRRNDAGDVFFATRPALGMPFGAPSGFPDPSGPNNDSGFRMTPDERTAVLTSTRPGGAGGFDVWLASRADPTQPFAAWTPVAAINSVDQEVDPALTVDAIYFASDRPGGPGGQDIWRASAVFPTTVDPPQLVAELNSPDGDSNPTLSGDGLVIVFASGRPGSEASALWYATRASTADAFDPPVRISALDTADVEFEPFLRPDGRELFFCAGGLGGNAELMRVDVF